MKEEQKEQLAVYVSYGMWQVPYCVKHALCEDGIRRYARFTTIEPDTYFSHPACVQVRGKTVSGYITSIETNGQRDYAFRAVKYGKNYNILPNKE